MNETEAKLAEFAVLDVGWYYGSGGPTTPEALTWAKDTVSFFKSIDIDQTDAFPDPEGGVRVVGYYKEHYFELTYELNGTITYYFGEYGTNIEITLDYFEGMTPDEAKKYVQQNLAGIKNGKIII